MRNNGKKIKNIFSACFYIIVFFIFFAHSSSVRAARQINVYNVAQLTNAFNSEQDGDEIVIHSAASGGPAGGIYVLPSMALEINVPNIIVRGATGNRDDVKILGDAMSGNAIIKVIFYFNENNTDNAIIKDITIGRVGWHAIMFSGQNNAGEGTVIDNVRIIDTYEQMIKGATDHINGTDNVTVKNSLFEYTAGIGPQYYIGGIDGHLSRGWLVQGNTFRHIQSPDSNVAEHAVHFWDDSAGTGNNIIERNLIIDSDRGIGLWLNNSGIIKNNMITHDGSGASPDVGIDIQNSPNVEIYNNTIYMAGSYPNAIEYRFVPTTNTRILNNLTNKLIVSRDGGSATVTNNITSAQYSWFKNIATGDLHLASAVTSVVDKGQSVSGLTNDFDGETRVGAVDIGADEYVTSSDTTPPAAPTGVVVN